MLLFGTIKYTNIGNTEGCLRERECVVLCQREEMIDCCFLDDQIKDQVI